MQPASWHPIRKKLPHDIPFGVPESPRLFVTIACAQRGSNILAHEQTWELITRTIDIYQAGNRWHAEIWLAMPDHLHGIVSIPGHASFRKCIADFKHATARFAHVAWQRDFFDHRLRDAESATAKFRYILHNPVRAGLVGEPEAWPYRWLPASSV